MFPARTLKCPRLMRPVPVLEAPLADFQDVHQRIHCSAGEIHRADRRRRAGLPGSIADRPGGYRTDSIRGRENRRLAPAGTALVKNGLNVHRRRLLDSNQREHCWR